MSTEAILERLGGAAAGGGHPGGGAMRGRHQEVRAGAGRRQDRTDLS